MPTLCKPLLYLLSAICLLSGCQKRSDERQKHVFRDEIRLRSTPVKHQGRSPLCWVYAMLATIETEHIEQGDSVNLSPDYLGRHLLMRETMRLRLSQQPSHMQLRGTMTMVPQLLQQYGMVPYDAYHNVRPANYHTMARRLEVIARSPQSLRAIQTAADDYLNTAIGHMPRHVFMLGVEYDAGQFARSVCRNDEYIALTSYAHHPFGEPFALEIADNRAYDTFLNVPIDTLMRCIEHAIRTRHAVCWEGDVTEKGFSFHSGTATIERVSRDGQAERQRRLERFQTTDDHCLTLVGIAHDQRGERFYIAKGSWGTANPYAGYMYLSENYVRMCTVGVMMSREALPENLRKTLR